MLFRFFTQHFSQIKLFSIFSDNSIDSHSNGKMAATMRTNTNILRIIYAWFLFHLIQFISKRFRH